jgi:hypothetical protein
MPIFQVSHQICFAAIQVGNMFWYNKNCNNIKHDSTQSFRTKTVGEFGVKAPAS